jgi:hypothetical protein
VLVSLTKSRKDIPVIVLAEPLVPVKFIPLGKLFEPVVPAGGIGGKFVGLKIETNGRVGGG